MSLPVRSLPVLQNWDCQGCSNCCREYQVSVTEEERQRILAQGWEKDPSLARVSLFSKQGTWWARKYRLNHREDETCVFLNGEGRCRIHERFGAEAKPLACRLYPFILVPAGNFWQVGLRFACPAVVSSKGRPVADHQIDLAAYAASLEQQAGTNPGNLSLPSLQVGQRIVWTDLLHFVRTLLAIIRNPKAPMENKLRRCLALANLCLKARFEAIKGGRLVEFLELVTAGLEEEVPSKPIEISPPSWLGKVLFRQGLAIYARKDHGPGRGLAVLGPTARVRAAWRFALGKGSVPRVHAQLPETTFEKVEESQSLLDLSAEKILERFYAVKLSSLQFFGPTNFGLPFWEGFQSLAFTFPMILWLARSFSPIPPDEAVARAVNIVDNNFAYNPLLGNSRFRFLVALLARRGELEKLIAWYSR